MASGNRWGHLFQLTTFGESHGPAMGCVIEGVPAGLALDLESLQRFVDRRRPGSAPWVTSRSEPDQLEILSGVYQGKTLGTPVAVVVHNVDARSKDYKGIGGPGGAARSGHADDVFQDKFGHSDPRGGGRASGRETISRVIAGGIAQQLVRALTASSPVTVTAFAEQIGPLVLNEDELRAAQSLNSDQIDAFAARFPSAQQSDAVIKLLLNAKDQGESFGGYARLWIKGAPRGLGQPVFRKLKNELASALMSIGAVSGVELGEVADIKSGVAGTEFHTQQSRAEEQPSAHQYGGIRGGISTGEPISMRILFKPTSSILDVAKRGRHDPCIIPRALVVVEAMTWIVLADHLLESRLDRLP